MKTNLIIRALFVAIAATAVLVSCNKDEHPTPRQNAAISPTISRAENDTWAASDEIGIYMIGHGQTLSASSILNGADNYQYVTSQIGTTVPVAPYGASDPIYYPGPALTAVDFIAYSPYTFDIAADYSFITDLKYQWVLDDFRMADILYSTNLKNITKTANVINFVFNHVMSKIVLNVSPGTGYTLADFTGNNLSATINGTPRFVAFSIVDGTIASGAAESFLSYTATDGQLFEAILAPQPSGGTGRSIDFTFSGVTYTMTIPDTMAFEAGKVYTYNITINRTGIVIKTTAITLWGNTTQTPTDLGELG